MIGEGEVGKTSLLASLRGDPWVENRATTHGVEVDIKSLVVQDTHSGTDITFNGWDFGGQSIYRHTHQLFFTAPAIYLAVWNPRRGPEQCRVDEWIKMVKHRAYDDAQPEAKPYIFVVATHGGPNERLDHIDEQALRDEFGDLIVGFHHIDSKTEFQLDDLKQCIAQTAAKIPQVGRAVAASWQRVIEAVRERSQTEPWIKYEQFQTLCTEQQVDLDLAKTYVAILNELGHLIHYSTDPTLKDTVILKPEWLSKAISFVLEDPQVKAQNGLVRHSRLSQLWNDSARGDDRYPLELHPVFCKLMERFDLSYQVELPDAEAQTTSLIAQLVPSKRPANWEQDWVLQPGDTERTQVCRLIDKETGRTVEAEGLMYRLIVRLHRYSLGRKNYYIRTTTIVATGKMA
ncbi:COR domain-containing protein [Acaryochloris sp. IP29b_bin.137]|uniref:COR domain-containing protein n=1 Tax=Acaryochloris sp. IP29b_bin.137 TaxID=2969217 RepID=UPI0026265A38|nr:COR domain-containing protein [Acaryochloris sp. IP29b_bin.137]